MPKSERLLVDERSMIEIYLNKALTPTMRKENSQEDTAEMTRTQLGHEECLKTSGHGETIADTTNDEGYCREMVT